MSPLLLIFRFLRYLMIKDGRFDLIQLKRGNDLLRPEIRVSYRVYLNVRKAVKRDLPWLSPTFFQIIKPEKSEKESCDVERCSNKSVGENV